MPGTQMPATYHGASDGTNGPIIIEQNGTADNEPHEETLSIQEKEKELIRKALEKHHGKRKAAAKELGISERTLYRKIKQYNLQ